MPPKAPTPALTLFHSGLVPFQRRTCPVIAPEGSRNVVVFGADW